MSWYDPRDWDLGGAAEGGLSGMMGPWGIAGGIVGAGMGAMGLNDTEARQMSMEDRNRALAMYDQAGTRQAAQAGVSDFRADQRDLVGRLQALASGRGPSLASEQLKMATDRATNQQFAMAAGARGNPALAQRNAANQAGMLHSQAAGQSAMARAAEQLGALQQLGGAAGMGRSMDDAQSSFNAGQQNQFAVANDMARLEALKQAGQFGRDYYGAPTRMEQFNAYGEGLKQDLMKFAVPGGGGGNFMAPGGGRQVA